MKYTEFIVDFTKALKSKNRVSVLELVVNNPFHARNSIDATNFFEGTSTNTYCKKNG
jgi:hypothetical protein